MKKFWTLLLTFYIAAVFVFSIGKIFSPWLLIGIPITLIGLFFLYPLKRFIALRQKGYFAGRRQADFWVYEERDKSQTRQMKIKLEYTEPGHHELFIPTDKEWRVVAPEWAMNRRQEIISRIIKCWKESDVHYPNDWVANA
ncbi:MAG: hypothetical protein WC236_00175 [Gallionellaceae bacterium]|jgi:hypothetical protein